MTDDIVDIFLESILSVLYSGIFTFSNGLNNLKPTVGKFFLNSGITFSILLSLLHGFACHAMPF